MIKVASTLAYRVRLANNRVPLVGNTLTWSRNCSVNVVDLKEVSLQKYFRETELMDKFVSCGSESLMQDVPNPSCDMIEEGQWFEREGAKYRPVLFRALFDECLKALDAGVRLSYLKRVLCYRSSELIGILKSKARELCRSRDIMQVATTAANGDRKIGSLIVKAIDRVGEGGVFEVSKWRKSNCELEFGSGMKTNWCFASPYFINRQAEGKCVLENPFILIYGGKLLNDMVIQRAIRLGKPLLVIAEDVERKVLGSVMLDRFLHGSKLCIVEPSVFTKILEEIMQDLAIFTGSKVVTSEFDMNLLPQVLGSCKQVTVSNQEMLILDWSKDIEEKCEQVGWASGLIFNKLKCSVDAGSVSEEIRERISKFSGEVAIFKVGGASNAEADKMYNRVTNALNASKDAMNGALPSGGVALLHASRALDDWLTGNRYEDIVIRILQRVMKMPVYSIATTAGFDGAAVVEKLLEQDNPNLGFDPTTGEYVDFMKSGIIDPMELITRDLSIATSNCLNILSLERHFSYVNPMED